MLAQLDAQLDGSSDDLPGQRGRIGDPVGRAEHRGKNVVRSQTGNRARIYTRDRHAELRLQPPSCLELVATFGRRRNEEIADLLEPLDAELLEEGDRLLRETHFGRGRELLANPAHCLAGRP